MCRGCNWRQVLDDIESYSDGFGAETLEGIQDWVTDHQHVTEAQRRAVSNIINAERGDYE